MQPTFELMSVAGIAVIVFLIEKYVPGGKVAVGGRGVIVGQGVYEAITCKVGEDTGKPNDNVE